VNSRVVQKCKSKTKGEKNIYGARTKCRTDIIVL